MLTITCRSILAFVGLDSIISGNKSIALDDPKYCVDHTSECRSSSINIYTSSVYNNLELVVCN